MTVSLETKIDEMIIAGFGNLAAASGTSTRGNLMDIHAVDPGFIEFAHRLLATGTDLGKEEARLTFTLVSNYGASDKSKAGQEAYARKVRILRENMHEKWSAGNVAEEIGQPQLFHYILGGMRRSHGELTAEKGGPESYDDSYWRGLAVLEIIRENRDVNVPTTTRSFSFIDWAGNHPNISDIVHTATERGITDLEYLQELMTDKSELAVPVQGGYL